MIKFLVLVVLIIECHEIACRTSESLKVKLGHGGVLVGRHLVTHNGRGIRAFMGIPYAEPPIGELRFKSPIPAGSWKGEKHVVKDSDLCIQRDPYRRDMELSGSEDCLYLNVYTPPISHNDVVKPKLPVMVFFHGGGWQCGSGIKDFYGPDFLMEHDIVFVSGNFRVGPLGFLSTGTADCPGNNGLKDQVEVLRWIQENIAQFGGDPKQVTVFGESAGGATGTYLMMSPLSKGLFSKVISQSGTNLDAWAQPAHKGVAPARAARLGELLGCKIEKDEKKRWKELIKCLKSKSADDITKAFYDFFEWDTDPMIPFPPVVEPNLPGAYITKHPREEIAPHALSLPWIVGLTMDEGAMKSAAFLNTPELMEDLNQNWDKALPIALYYDHHSAAKQQEITKGINEFYFNNRKLSEETGQNFTNLFTDGWFWHGIENSLRIRLEQSDQAKVGPTYVYLFAQKASASFTEIFQGGRDNYYGVCHAEELQYLFPIAKELFLSAVPTAEEIEMRKIITTIWVDFAKTGNPTPEGSEYVKWEPVTKFPLNYYRFGTKDFEGRPIVGMEKRLMEERSAFWNKHKPHLPAVINEKGEL